MTQSPRACWCAADQAKQPHHSPFSSKTEAIPRHPMLAYSSLCQPILAIFDPLSFFGVSDHPLAARKVFLFVMKAVTQSPIQRVLEKNDAPPQNSG